MKKGFCVAVWDREDYTMETEKQLKDRVVYKDIDFKEKILQEVTETNESFSRNLKKNSYISEKERKYSSIKFKKATNFGKI